MRLSGIPARMASFRVKRLLTMQVVNHGQHDLITVFIPATPAP